ncbi:MAG: TlpA disulfide reductase family protein [Pyrinomonadaceae bacterium]|nr:TlpA family protein disulfide reductase [Pyrinomonadaceae bacterium]
MKNFYVLFAVLVFAFSISAQNQIGASPSFAAIDMAGQKVDTTALKGKVVVLNLWFINCPNCVEEIKLLNALVDQYIDNKDVVFLGVAASRKPDLEKFLVKNPFKYTVIPNGSMIIISKFGDAGKNGELSVPFPMHYVLDRDGKIVTKVQGIKGIEAVKAELTKQLAKR